MGVSLAGITRHPTEPWMEQMARNAIDEASGHLRKHRYVLHDRDTKFCASFQAMLATGNVNCIALPPRSPNLNAFAERWVRSIKQKAGQKETDIRLLRHWPTLEWPCDQAANMMHSEGTDTVIVEIPAGLARVWTGTTTLANTARNSLKWTEA